MNERNAPVRVGRTPGAEETNRSRKQSVSFGSYDKPRAGTLARVWTATISVKRRRGIPLYLYTVSLTDGRTVAILCGEVPALHPLAGTEATLQAVAAAKEWLRHIHPRLVGRITIRAAADPWPLDTGRRGAL